MTPALSPEEEADLAELVHSGEAKRLRELFGIPAKSAAQMCGSSSGYSLLNWEQNGLTQKHRREHRRGYYDFLCDLRDLEQLIAKYGKFFGASTDKFVKWREKRPKRE